MSDETQDQPVIKFLDLDDETSAELRAHFEREMTKIADSHFVRVLAPEELEYVAVNFVGVPK